MNKKVLLTLGILTAMTSVCMAADWVDLGNGSYASTYMIRNKKDGNINTWSRFYPSIGFSYNNREIAYIEASHRVKCSNKTLTTEKTWLYDQNNEVIESAVPPVIKFNHPNNSLVQESALVEYTCGFHK